MKVTRKQVSNFRNTTKAYLQNKPEVNLFSRALYHVMKRTKEIDEETQERIEDLRIDLATKESNDEKNVSIKNGSYNYTTENLKKLEKGVRKIRGEEVEVEPYIAKEVPSNLEFMFEEQFIPFVIEKSKFEMVEETKTEE